jgi:acyl carrier protein
MLEQIRDILTDTLRLGERGQEMSSDTALLGNIPEFDSMSVVTVVMLLEEEFDIEFEDDDITADSFATLGDLVHLVEQKLDS